MKAKEENAKDMTKDANYVHKPDVEKKMLEELFRRVMGNG